MAAVPDLVATDYPPGAHDPKLWEATAVAQLTPPGRQPQPGGTDGGGHKQLSVAKETGFGLTATSNLTFRMHVTLLVASGTRVGPFPTCNCL